MKLKSITDDAVVLDAATLAVVPTPPINLHSIDAVRHQMQKVYRDMRAGKLDTQDGTRLVYVLTQIAKLHESADLVRRLDRLEELTDGSR